MSIRLAASLNATNPCTGEHSLLGIFLRYAPVQIFSALSVFALISIQTRFLDPSEYGLLAVSVVLLELVRTVCTQWLNTSMLRLYPGASDEVANGLISNIFFMTLVSTFASVFILTAVLFFYTPFVWEFYLCLVVLLGAKSIFQFNVDYARLSDNYRGYVLATLFQSLFSVLFTVTLLLVYETLASAVLGLALSYLAGLYWVNHGVKPQIYINKAKEIASYGIPLMLSGGIALLYSRADRLIMPKFLPLEDVGIYAAQANLIAGVMALVFMIVALPLYPALTKVSNDRTELSKKHQQYLTYLLFVSLPSLVALCMMNVRIADLFLGEKYSKTSPILFIVLALSFYLINFRQHYIDHGLQFLLKTTYLIPISTVAVLMTFASLPFMLYYFGLNGAAFTILLVSFAASVMSFFAAFIFGYRFVVGVDAIKILLSAILMALLMYAFSKNGSDVSSFYLLFMNVAVSTAFYLVFCFAINVANCRAKLKIIFS